MIEHIKSHILSHGYPPSIRELMKLTGMASTNTVWRALRKLEASGDITVEPGQSRAIRLNGYHLLLIESGIGAFTQYNAAFQRLIELEDLEHFLRE